MINTDRLVRTPKKKIIPNHSANLNRLERHLLGLLSASRQVTENSLNVPNYPSRIEEPLKVYAKNPRKKT